MAGLEVTSGMNLAEFGFVTMQRQGRRRWTATLRDVEGEPILKCSLRAEGLSCEPSESGLSSMPRASHVR